MFGWGISALQLFCNSPMEDHKIILKIHTQHVVNSLQNQFYGPLLLQNQLMWLMAHSTHLYDRTGHLKTDADTMLLLTSCLLH